MWFVFKHYPTFFAVALHAVLLTLLFWTAPFTAEPIVKEKTHVIVQARLVDQSKINAEKARIQAAKDKLIKARTDKQLKAKLKRDKAEKLRLKKIADNKAKKKKAKEKKAKEKKAKEKKAKEKKAKEKKAKEKKAKEKKAKEKKVKADKEKKRKALQQRKKEEKQRQIETEKLLQDGLRREQQAEQERLAREHEMQKELDQMEIDKFSPLIHDKVRDNWVFAGKSAGLSCALIVRLAPGGFVLDVKLSRSSGNKAFDRSAVAAVRKADTLPVASGALFNRLFREIEIIFAP